MNDSYTQSLLKQGDGLFLPQILSFIRIRIYFQDRVGETEFDPNHHFLLQLIGIEVNLNHRHFLCSNHSVRGFLLASIYLDFQRLLLFADPGTRKLDGSVLVHIDRLILFGEDTETITNLPALLLFVVDPVLLILNELFGIFQCLALRLGLPDTLTVCIW